MQDGTVQTVYPALRLPERMVERTEEQNALRQAIGRTGPGHVHLAGPHGSGKTLLTAVALQETPTRVCYVPCRRYDTQYQVLARLTAVLTGESVADGYHTAQLQRRAATALAETPAILVLDDVEFLLSHDGDDLLYGLLRLEPTCSIVTTATPAVDLTAVLDDRTYSSYQPRHLSFASYTEAQAAQIYGIHAADMDRPVTDAAVRCVANQTTNIRAGLCWLARVADVSPVITARTIERLRWDALHRYWRETLAAFTQHHAIVLKAIEQVTGETDRAYTGMVYDRYAGLCRCRDWQPLTVRRIGDLLDDLEFLGLIDVEHRRGGAEGRTRVIRLTPLEEL